MSDKEPTDLIGKVHRFLGMKPSAEQQAEIDRITREGETANAALKKALSADAEGVRRGLEANAAAHHQATQEYAAGVHEQLVHMPKHLDVAEDMEAIMAAARNRENIVDVRNRTAIYQWDDGYGHVVYLRPSVRVNQVQAVSTRITEQGKAFGILEGDEQTRIRTEFDSSKGVATGIQPYQDFLQSEALGRRFQELKQSRPTPK